jgi:hypothetical protein
MPWRTSAARLACKKNKLGSVDRRDGDRRVVGRSGTG